jgi:hypothetical protein
LPRSVLRTDASGEEAQLLLLDAVHLAASGFSLSVMYSALPMTRRSYDHEACVS